jgi:hypothetical protein
MRRPKRTQDQSNRMRVTDAELYWAGFVADSRAVGAHLGSPGPKWPDTSVARAAPE